MAWPKFLPAAWEIDPQYPVHVGDIVSVTLGIRRQYYKVVAIDHGAGTADLELLED